ncbi:MAG TPA: hypothetical protein VFZ95_01015 [Steroidobacteraceae bacterium]
MPKPRFLLCLGAALICLAGCNAEDMVKKVASDEDQQGATQCIDALHKKRFDAIEAHLDPQLRSPETRPTLEHMAAMLPPGEPDAVKLVGANINVSSQGARTADLIYQYTFGKRYFMVNCGTRTEEEKRSIVALNVKELEFPIEQQAGFGLANKTPGQYGILVAAVLFLALTLTALITCIMDKRLPRKWLWILFIIVGIGKLSINWNSGTWDFSPVNILLFSVSAVSRGYAGWVLSIALPVGAAVYLARRWLNHRTAARSKAA